MRMAPPIGSSVRRSDSDIKSRAHTRAACQVIRVEEGRGTACRACLGEAGLLGDGASSGEEVDQRGAEQASTEGDEQPGRCRFADAQRDPCQHERCSGQRDEDDGARGQAELGTHAEQEVRQRGRQRSPCRRGSGPGRPAGRSGAGRRRPSPGRQSSATRRSRRTRSASGCSWFLLYTYESVCKITKQRGARDRAAGASVAANAAQVNSCSHARALG